MPERRPAPKTATPDVMQKTKTPRAFPSESPFQSVPDSPLRHPVSPSAHPRIAPYVYVRQPFYDPPKSPPFSASACFTVSPNLHYEQSETMP